MARPPIIVNPGMAQNSFKQTNINPLAIVQGLSALWNLYDSSVGEEKRNRDRTESAKQIASQMNLGTPETAVVGSDSYGSGDFLNTISRPGIDIDALAKSDFGRLAINEMWKSKNTPLKGDAFLAALATTNPNLFKTLMEGKKQTTETSVLGGILKTQGLEAYEEAKKSQSSGRNKTVSPFMNYYNAMKEKGSNDWDIYEGWRRQQLEGQIEVAKERIPGYAQMSGMPPGWVYDRRTGSPKYTGNEQMTQVAYDFLSTKSAIRTTNSQRVKNIVSAGEALFVGTYDEMGNQVIPATFDKLVAMRDNLPEGVFGSLSSKLKEFNKWDQFLAWQTSDPDMAPLKATVVAAVERMAQIYQGGTGATSDTKMKMASQLLDISLDKDAFANMIYGHEDDLMNIVNKYAEVRPNKVGAPPRHKGTDFGEDMMQKSKGNGPNKQGGSKLTPQQEAEKYLEGK